MKTTPISSLDLSLPASWQQLSDTQLSDVAQTMVSGRTAPYAKTLLLLRWNGLHPVSPRGFRRVPGHHWLRRGSTLYRVSIRQIAAATAVLDFLDTPPESPLRPEHLRGHAAVRADLKDTQLGEWLQVENLYQGFLQSRRPEALDRAAAVLYPGFEGQLSEAERFSMLLWMAGLKNLFARQFEDLYSPASPGTAAEAPSQHELMLAQLRALTGGDVTKMQLVREAATWDALDELNAKAREAREMKRKVKS